VVVEVVVGPAAVVVVVELVEVDVVEEVVLDVVVVVAAPEGVKAMTTCARAADVMAVAVVVPIAPAVARTPSIAAITPPNPATVAWSTRSARLVRPLFVHPSNSTVEFESGSPPPEAMTTKESFVAVVTESTETFIVAAWVFDPTIFHGSPVVMAPMKARITPS
jgi:hypothetical protein